MNYCKYAKYLNNDREELLHYYHNLPSGKRLSDYMDINEEEYDLLEC